ncbi:MAG: DUF1036 domain-containing protein, partial [Hyphomicrobiaceae bacterium]
GVALGYQAVSGWTTEGWWTIAAQSCETLLRGKLPSEILYLHAIDYDRGGEWSGDQTFCIKDQPFTIRNTGRCEESGATQAGFMKVDTQGQRNWTIRLDDPPDPESSK